jgi:hypothetical protein
MRSGTLESRTLQQQRQAPIILISTLQIDWLLFLCAKLSTCRVTSKRDPFFACLFALFWMALTLAALYFYIIYSSDLTRFHQQSSVVYAEQRSHVKVLYLSNCFIAQMLLQTDCRRGRR